jgi:hypothetical protein
MPATVDDPHRTRRTTYVVLAAAFTILALVALFVFRSGEDSVTARQKADQLRIAFADGGLPEPDRDQIIRTLGDDGGAVCADPEAALKQATLDGMLANGAAGPGQRPVLADAKVLQGEALIIQTYCPAKLPAFTRYVADLNLNGEVAG